MPFWHDDRILPFVFLQVVLFHNQEHKKICDFTNSSCGIICSPSSKALSYHDPPDAGHSDVSNFCVSQLPSPSPVYPAPCMTGVICSLRGSRLVFFLSLIHRASSFSFPAPRHLRQRSTDWPETWSQAAATRGQPDSGIYSLRASLLQRVCFRHPNVLQPRNVKLFNAELLSSTQLPIPWICRPQLNDTSPFTPRLWYCPWTLCRLPVLICHFSSAC